MCIQKCGVLECEVQADVTLMGSGLAAEISSEWSTVCESVYSS